MADNCLFCKIVDGEIPATVVVDDDQVMAFRDLNPVAPTHVLVIPKRHISAADQIGPDDAAVLAAMFVAAKQAAAVDGVDQTGYRTVFNVGDDAGQSVPHLHLHVLGGRQMSWPPG
ncbi:MAG TPA: histidine triad nucleotide-binding protein [Acidimicrobiales bacterium]|nr:histidine triad nucleotide-binding protein [Acidimicrobiales bacterium]